MRFLVNAPAGLRPNRMQRPTEAYRRADAARWSRDWGTVGVKEAQRIFDAGMSKGAPAWLRPPGAREALPAPYDRAAARRDYLAAMRAPLAEARGLRPSDYKGNPGIGRRVTFHGAFSSQAAARRKERQVGGFIQERTIGGSTRYVVLTPKRRPGKAARNPAPLEARTMARRRSRSRRRKGARRPRRRAAARVTLSTNPRKRTRRHRGRATARRGARRHFRRNPAGGLFGGILRALLDGLKVTGGVAGQNAIVRYVPNFIPPTVPRSEMLNALTKDVLGIVVGSWGAHRVVSADTARFIVAGQAHAAIARVIRVANIPEVSTLMGEYDPIRLGVYTSGVRRLPAQASPAAIAAANGGAGNVRTLRNVGIYTDGVAYSPSLY